MTTVVRSCSKTDDNDKVNLSQPTTMIWQKLFELSSKVKLSQPTKTVKLCCLNGIQWKGHIWANYNGKVIWSESNNAGQPSSEQILHLKIVRGKDHIGGHGSITKAGCKVPWNRLVLDKPLGDAAGHQRIRNFNYKIQLVSKLFLRLNSALSGLWKYIDDDDAIKLKL